ncbi:uncharacterized protein [Canis lupus baileyi]|uniref:uncharacterized protein n=1 Tax=Canis lupus baileyi TaxID=143281 RepID=UPI003B970562
MTLTDAWQPGHCDWRRGQARKLKRRVRRAPPHPLGAPPGPPRRRRGSVRSPVLGSPPARRVVLHRPAPRRRGWRSQGPLPPGPLSVGGRKAASLKGPGLGLHAPGTCRGATLGRPPPPRTRRRHPEGEPSRGRARWAASGPQPPAVGPPAVGPPAQAWSAVERPTPGAQAPLNRFAALDTLTASCPGSKELASQGGHRWLTERHQFWSSDLRLLAIPYLMHLETVFDM